MNYLTTPYITYIHDLYRYENPKILVFEPKK